MQWFKRHLNWAYILSMLCLSIAFCFMMPVVELYGPDWMLYAGLLMAIIGYLGVAGWVIKQKNRSLWYLVLYFIGILLIVVLCLKNKSEEVEK